MKRDVIKDFLPVGVGILVLGFSIAASGTAPQEAKGSPLAQDDWSELNSGADVYAAACASCHGADGTGTPKHILGFEAEVPDFTDCAFASREPQADWFAVAHNGGPTRGFDEMMPAFGGALTDDQIDKAATHVKGFCKDDNWPDGAFNMPRALVTGKAFPEDEYVWELESTLDEPVQVQFKFIVEKRIGARQQVEFILPVGVQQVASIDANGNTDYRWGEGLGDLGLAWKGVLWHSLRRGTIGSMGAEVFLPVGDEKDGFSKGIFRLEPFIAIGQLLPGDTFLQLHGGAELSTDTDVADHEIFWRGAIGHSFTQCRFGRTWSPMVEVIGARELASGAKNEWSVVPALHITLNTRQHVMLVLGAEIPVTDADERQIKGMLHLLWDWYDGAFTEGW
ncbi:MAG: cytochrome c [Myxococcota bacterium]|nr:cytochrome c [Myxococcota bacterium]